MKVNFCQETIYILNLNNYLLKNFQLIDAINWNNKLYNIVVLDETNDLIKNIINTDNIFNWLKDNVGWPQACDYLRFKLISKYDFDCFIDMDIILNDCSLSNYTNYIARYNNTELNCNIIKGKDLSTRFYNWLLDNFKNYDKDDNLPIEIIKDIPYKNPVKYVHLFNVNSNKPANKEIIDFKAKSIKDYLKNRPNDYCRYIKI